MTASAARPAQQAHAIKPMPDRLWLRCEQIIQSIDPQTSGRQRTDARAALDGIIYRKITGCAWNRLPPEFGDDSTVHRTSQRWERKGILNKLFAVIILESSRSAARHAAKEPVCQS